MFNADCRGGQIQLYLALQLKSIELDRIMYNNCPPGSILQL